MHASGISGLIVFSSVFLNFACVTSRNVNYTISVHSAPPEEPFPAVFAEEGDILTVECANVDTTSAAILNSELYEHWPNGTKEKLNGTYSIKFKSSYTNGNLISCEAKNTLGQKITGTVRILSAMNKPFYKNWQSCDQDKFCLNRGTCYIDPDQSDVKICVCTTMFGGKHCQESIFLGRGHHQISTPPSLAGGVNWVTFGVSMLVAIVCIVGLILSTFYYWYRHKNERKLRQQRVCAHCNRNHLPPLNNDSTQTSERRPSARNANNSKEYSAVKQSEL